MTQSPFILIVDDDDSDRRAARRALQAGDPDVRVVEGGTGGEAILHLEGAAPPDLVLCDAHLPDGDSLLVLRRAQGLSIPTVMLTAHGDEGVAVELMKAGAADCLPKPGLSPAVLWRCLRAVLRLLRAEGDAVAARRAHGASLRAGEERLRALYDITSGSDGLDPTVDRLLAEGCRQFGLEAGMVMRLLGERQVVKWAFPKAGHFPVGETSAVGDTYCRDVLQSREALGIDDADTPEWRDRAAHRVKGVSCYLGATISLRGVPWGTLCFADRKPRDLPFTPGDREYVRLMAQWIGGELRRQEAEEGMRRSVERYHALTGATGQLVWTNSPEGEMRGPQPAWSDFTGQTEADYLGYGWTEAVHPEDAAPTVQAWAAAVAARDIFRFEHRVRRRDGVYRLFSIRAVPVLDADGSLREWVGVHTDITERRQAEDRLRFLAEATTLLASSLDYDQTLTRVAQLAVPLLGDWCVVDLVTEGGAIQRVFTAQTDPGRTGAVEEWQKNYPVDPDAPNGAPRAIRTGLSEIVTDLPDALLAANITDPTALQRALALGMRSYLCVPLTTQGRTLGAITLIAAESGRHYGAADLELAEDLARRAALAVDNARLYQETRQRAEREALVNRIGRALRASLDSAQILDAATREVGQALQVGRCHLAALTAGRDALEVAPQQYVAPGVPRGSTRFPLSAFPPEMLAEWRAGHLVAVSDTRTDPSASFIRPLLRPDITLTAFVSCPLFLRGEWSGQLIVHQTDGPREWTRDDIALLASVSDMLTLALENARLYTREHRVAEMLQAAFLPDIPDRLHGMDLAKMYRSGLEEAQVGGDLYDAFALSDGRVALVIADVSGKGLDAAVQTATVKYSLRAFAAEAASPALVLRRLNRTLRSEVSGLGEHFVTLFYAVFDPRTGRLTYAGAGHETQLIKRAAGGVTALDASGPILGIAEHRYGQQVEYLHPGDSLVLFTDGLTEARAPGTREMLDLGRVADAVAGMDAACGAGAIVAHLEKLALDWTAGRPQDDLALLAARRVILEGPEAEMAAAPEADGNGVTVPEYDDEELLFGFSFPASPDCTAEVRQAVAHWMDLLGYDRTQVEDFQTAVTEAVTNAVRHGSPCGVADTFRVSGFRRPTESFVVEIADSGPGLAVPLGSAVMPAPEATGGRGLPLMSAYADELILLPAPIGLRLRLVKTRSARPVK